MGSKKPGKQRAFVRNAPAHVRSSLLCSRVSDDVRQKVKRRSLRVRKGDKVKVMRGQFVGKTGVVDRVDTERSRVFIQGVEQLKRDGGKSLYPLHPSKLLIVELEGKDKRRLVEAKPVGGSK